ncbi:MAG: hypothetical protein AAGD11_14460 [Planctomycetota bacterium]
MSSSPPREPHLLRFRLRQLFFFVTLLSVLCAALVLTDGPWPLVILVTTVLIAAHVFGTLVGNRLRDTSDEMQRWRTADPRLDDDAPLADKELTEAAKLTLPPSTPLADHGRVSNWLVWFVVGGALLGMFVGGTILALTIGSRIGWAGWAVGTISCGVLCTWVAFLASSFGTIARHAWRHATEEGD